MPTSTLLRLGTTPHRHMDQGIPNDTLLHKIQHLMPEAAADVFLITFNQLSQSLVLSLSLCATSLITLLRSTQGIHEKVELGPCFVHDRTLCFLSLLENKEHGLHLCFLSVFTAHQKYSKRS